MDQRNIRIWLAWLCSNHQIDLLPWKEKTLGVSKDSTGKFNFYVYENWLYSSDPAVFEILEGGFYHEALGHARHTTFSEFLELEDKSFKWTPLARHIANILEDIYIEKKAMGIYPTVRPALIRTVEILNRDDFFWSDKEPEKLTPVSLLTGALLNFCRGKLLPGQDVHLQANMDAIEQLIPSTLGDLWPKVWDIAKESIHAESSLEIAELTKSIMVLIKDVAKSSAPSQSPDPSAPEDGDGKDSSDGQGSPSNQGSGQANTPSEGGDGSEGASDGTSQPSKSAKSAKGKKSGKGSSSDASPESQDNGEGQSNSADNNAQPGDAISDTPSDSGNSSDSFNETAVKAAKEIIKQSKNKKALEEQELSDVIAKAVDKAIEAEGGQGCSYSPLTEITRRLKPQNPEVLQVAAKIKSASNDLEELLMAETFTRRELVERGNRIDRQQLVRGASGFTSHIFSRETKGDGLSTAVFGLFDYSGSMDSNFMQGCSTGLVAAEGIMVGLGDILDEYEVPYEFAAFSDNYMTIKSFEEDGDLLRRKRMSPHISGGTVTGEATQLALSRLVARKEARKLLVIVTDGDTSDVELLISCYNEAKHMGIEVASVMLGDVVRSIKELSARTKMKAIATNQVSGLGRFVVDQIKAAI
jgi:hypothetical protein